MTEEHADRRPALRAVPDPGTDLEVADETAPAPVDQPDETDRTLYATVLGTRSAERLPVVPAWARNRGELAQVSRWAAAHAGHTSAYHAVRAPAYVGRLSARAPRGAGRVLAGAARWVFDGEGAPVRADAVRRGDAAEYMRLLDRRNARVRLRLLVAAGGLAAALAGVGVLVGLAPAAAQWGTLAAAVIALGVAGAPADRPLAGPAVVRTEAAKLTSAAVIRALGALGISEINKALSDKGGGISFPAPISRDGPGWRADIDLPHGVTVSDILERREKLASGLRRPLGCVWPEPAHDQHAGRLVLWVGDQDMSKARQPAWPLAKSGRADVFGPVPFGTDQRGRQVTVELMFNSVLIGAMPRQGKTFALRVLALAAALDPRVQLQVFELKGTGDLSPLEKVAHQYGSGLDDDTVKACLDSLTGIEKELERRSKTIRDLPRGVCPESKVTPELAAQKALGLAPIAFVVDECQELFTHPEYGKEADRLATRIVKLGPAMGVMLILATQRPDSKSLPTGVSANAGVRFCLRVMGQVENDMVLGTSMYQTGVRATTFTAKDKGIGYLVGASDDPQIARSYYLDGPAAERVTGRARARREAAGTLSGYAIGDEPERPSHDVLADVAAVIQPGEDQLWSETVLERLAELRPDVYGRWEPGQLSTALQPHGVKTQQVWGRTADGRKANRRGLAAERVTAALERRQRS